MDTKALAAQYHRDGFVIARNVFTKDEIAALARLIEDYIRTIVPKLGAGDVYYEDSPSKPVKALHGMGVHTKAFDAYAADPRIMRLLEAIWPGGPVLRDERSISYFGKPARDGSVTPPHQDNGFWYFTPPLAGIVTIAIDESTPENGALICAKGSHDVLREHRPSGVMGFSETLTEPFDTKRYPEVHVCMKPGDISVHHMQTIHRSEANRTDRSRRQLAFIYRSSLAGKDEAALAKHKQVVAALHAARKN